MTALEKQQILISPIIDLGLSESFCEVCVAMKIKCLYDVIEMPRGQLFRHPRFTYHWLAELIGFLEKYDMVSLLHAHVRENTSD